MEENERFPVLISHKPLKPEFVRLQKIIITSDIFTIGRGLHNAAVIPFLGISRNHCVLKKTDHDEWIIEDYSSFGIEINNYKLTKGSQKVLTDKDIINLDPSEQFVYIFKMPSTDEVPRKKIKLETTEDYNVNIFNDVKTKFEASQSYTIQHLQNKIQNVKQMQETSLVLKHQIQLDMDRQIKQLKNGFALQIENLRGEKDQVDKQKTALIEERDAQLTAIKFEMEGRIAELMDQIKKNNETESELLNENKLLKERLTKEREEFLSELSQENSSKQELLKKLEDKIKEQKEICFKEKQDLEQTLRKETEQLKLAKEKELKQLEEEKILREKQLEQELNAIKKNLEEQVHETEQQRLKAVQQLNEQMQLMKKSSSEEKVKIEQLVHERGEIEKKLNEATLSSEKSLQELRAQVAERETELAALAADRIQKQAEQSSEVISNLQEQLEKVKNQLQNVETEKNTLLENICQLELPDTEASKQTTLAAMGELMESELQCSICAELFISANTLNCSHTFCKYCIEMWKKKKNDCPICRSPITSQCNSLVLDTFIEKMVQNLTEEMKSKRQDLLKYREELELNLIRQNHAGTSGGSVSSFDSDNFGFEEEQEEEYEDFENYWRRTYDDSDGSSDTISGSDNSDGFVSTLLSLSPADVSNSSEGRSDSDVSDTAGFSGRGDSNDNRYCYDCGSNGHWPSGCPYG